MVRLLFILIFIPQLIVSQGYPMHDATSILADMQGGWGFGNECGVDNYIVTNVYSNMNMNYNTLQILNANITVHGIIENEGIIEFLCDTAVLTVLGETLSTPLIEEYEFKVFPNPTRDFVNINGLGIKQIIFYDINGRIVKNFITPTIANRVSVHNLPSGIYFIRILDVNNNITIKKLLKK